MEGDGQGGNQELVDDRPWMEQAFPYVITVCAIIGVMLLAKIAFELSARSLKKKLPEAELKIMRAIIVLEQQQRRLIQIKIDNLKKGPKKTIAEKIEQQNKAAKLKSIVSKEQVIVSNKEDTNSFHSDSSSIMSDHSEIER